MSTPTAALDADGPMSETPQVTTETWCAIVYVERRVKGRTTREYLTAADGSLFHTDHTAAYELLSARIKAGWKKGVSEGLRLTNGAWIREGTMTLTPPTKAAL